MISLLLQIKSNIKSSFSKKSSFKFDPPYRGIFCPNSCLWNLVSNVSNGVRPRLIRLKRSVPRRKEGWNFSFRRIVWPLVYTEAADSSKPASKVNHPRLPLESERVCGHFWYRLLVKIVTIRVETRINVRLPLLIHDIHPRPCLPFFPPPLFIGFHPFSSVSLTWPPQALVQIHVDFSLRRMNRHGSLSIVSANFPLSPWELTVYVHAAPTFLVVFW